MIRLLYGISTPREENVGNVDCGRLVSPYYAHAPLLHSVTTYPYERLSAPYELVDGNADCGAAKRATDGRP